LATVCARPDHFLRSSGDIDAIALCIFSACFSSMPIILAMPAIALGSIFDTIWKQTGLGLGINPLDLYTTVATPIPILYVEWQNRELGRDIIDCPISIAKYKGGQPRKCLGLTHRARVHIRHHLETDRVWQCGCVREGLKVLCSYN